MHELLTNARDCAQDAPWPCVVIGGGAAGLMAAIASGRAGCRVLLLDGARRLGAKILISGGGRCNVTNAAVRAADFNGGPRRTIARVLDRWPVDETVRFFLDLGVPLHEEARGKLFPDTNRARTIVDALLAAAEAAGVRIRTESRVLSVSTVGDGFEVRTANEAVRARTVVLATGGLAVPKTGSDGSGYHMAAALGHELVPTTPALVPLVLGNGFHASVTGTSVDVECEVRVGARRAAITSGPLLWTHFGVSGPAALDVSRHWHHAAAEHAAPELRVNLRPGKDAGAVDRELANEAATRPRALAAKLWQDGCRHR